MECGRGPRYLVRVLARQSPRLLPPLRPPLLSRFDADPSVYGLPLGPLDDDPGIRPQMHVFVASKAPWYEIADDLPGFDGFPTGPHDSEKTDPGS